MTGRPNIIGITLDDGRYDAIGARHAMPGDAAAMPKVWAEMVLKGTMFKNGFNSSPLCGPSRAAYLTGQYAHNNGVLKNHGVGGWIDAFDDSSTLFTWLKAAGYTTALVGKYGNDYEQVMPDVPPGLDKFSAIAPTAYYNYSICDNGAVTYYGSAPSDYSTDVLSSRAQGFINHAVNVGAAPFFLWLTPFGPHLPSTPAPRHAGAFDGLPLVKPPSFNKLPVPAPAWLQAIPALNQAKLELLASIRQKQLEAQLAVDDAVGTLVALCEALGIMENTVFIYQHADNGFQWGEHRLRKKNSYFEPAIRMTVVVRHPDFPDARSEDRMIANVDIPATICDLAGVTPGIAPFNGVSFLPLLSGDPVESRRTDVLLEHTHEDGEPDAENPPDYVGIRTAGRKLILGDGWGEMFDLDNDPDELVDLIDSPAYAVEREELSALITERRAE